MTVGQLVWREKADAEDDPQGIGVSFQYGYADEAVSEVADHVGSGFSWTGAFEGRNEDMWGVGVTYARLSDEADFAHGHETAIEWFYKIQLTPWLALKPDLQYIINPSDGGDIDDVLAGTLRVDVIF